MKRVAAVVCFERDGSVSVAAPADELVALGRALFESAEIAVEDTPPTLAPGCEPATCICVRREVDPGLSIERDGDAVALVGNGAAIARLAGDIEEFGRTPSQFGRHIHVEYFPGHAYLRPGSIPVVVMAS